jgi:hypothetical protein
MATSRLKVTELDFDTIKTNLRAFLNQQDEFTDYDFEGSALSVLIDLLAYNTHYNAYYLNMIANESFLDTALLRDSVVSHAKSIGYTPASRKAPVAKVKIIIQTDTTTPEILTIPRGTRFSSEIIGDFTYSFITTQNYTTAKKDKQFIFEEVEIYEGILNTVVFNYDAATNPRQVFTLPGDNIDTRTLKISVKNEPSSSAFEIYDLSTNIIDLNSTSSAYYIQEGRNLSYEIYFGDGFISKKLNDGAQITATYLVTNGSDANKSSKFINLFNIGGYSDVEIQTLIPAYGGSEREGVDSIKFAAPQSYSTQNRLVTVKDYAAFLQTSYPGIQSVSVWGGEDQVPVVYNKVFISLKMKDGYFLSEQEKDRIVNEIIRPKALVTTTAEIVEPEYLYLNILGKVNYDSSRTSLSSTDLRSVVRNSVINYNNLNLETFNSRYVQSRLQDDIDNSDSSVIGSVIETKVQKRISVTLNQLKKYTVDFGIELRRGALQDRLISRSFDVLDFQGIRRTVKIEEISYSSTGIESIQITNQGSKYKSTPTITITGDGQGATAEAVVLNGSVVAINVTNPGINYTSATVTISGDGMSATAIPVIQNKLGYVRTVYYNEKSEPQIINANAGTIYYDEGRLELNELDILSLTGDFEELWFDAFAKDTIISSKRNTIVLIDTDLFEAIDLELVAI